MFRRNDANAQQNSQPLLFTQNEHAGRALLCERSTEMKDLTLLTILCTAGVGLTRLNAQGLEQLSDRSGTAQLVSLRLEPDRTFEEQITNSRWTFPWEGQMRSIELKANGELILGWNKRAKGFRWECPGSR
jgi:hypothetical protein